MKPVLKKFPVYFVAAMTYGTFSHSELPEIAVLMIQNTGDKIHNRAIAPGAYGN